MLIPWRVGLWTRELKIFENGLKKKHHLAVVLALYHTVSIVSSDSSKDISTGGFNSLRCSTKPSVHSPVLMLEKPYNSSELASDKAIPIQLHGNVKSMYQNKMTIPCKQTWGQLIRRSDTHTLKKKTNPNHPEFHQNDIARSNKDFTYRPAELLLFHRRMWRVDTTTRRTLSLERPKMPSKSVWVSCNLPLEYSKRV